MAYKFSVIVEKEKDWFVALCPEVEVASQGKTIEETMSNLKEAVQLFLETASKEEINNIILGDMPPLVSTFEVTALGSV